MDRWRDRSQEEAKELTLLSRDELEEIVHSRTVTLENVMDAMVDVLFKLDEAGRIELANQAVRSTLGYDTDAIVGKPIDALLATSEERATETEPVTAGTFSESLLREGQVPDMEVSFIAADGTVIPMSLSTSVMERDGDGIDGFVCVAKDVSERLERERALQYKNEQLELLNQLVRHDIHNDVILIIELARRVRQHASSSEDPLTEDLREYEFLEQIEQSGERIVSLTETARRLIETFAKLDESRTPIDLAPVLKREIVNASTLSQDVEIQVDGEIPHVSVWANELLASVFRNLLTNAIQHNDNSAPVVTISAAVTERHVTVQIADNGPGLPAELLSSLRSDERPLETRGPHGFGLYIVETVLTQYDGRLEVQTGDTVGDTDPSERGNTETWSEEGNTETWSEEGNTETWSEEGDMNASSEGTGTTFAVTLERAIDSETEHEAS